MGETYRTDSIPDQWELYDLTNDPIESLNLWNEPKVKEVFNYMKQRLNQERLYSFRNEITLGPMQRGNHQKRS